MSGLGSIIKDGFSVKGKNQDIELPLISLRIALKAYFSTYHCFDISLYMRNNNASEEIIDWSHNTDYIEAYTECIVHFQHFAELICKNFLRAEHILLTSSTPEPILLHKLLLKEDLPEKELEKLKTVEFSETLNRLVKLIKGHRINDHEQLSFIVEFEGMLKELNYIRNRVWHRGTYILRYPALDKFVGEYILPFITEVFNHPVYSLFESDWKYNRLACKLDPLNEIISYFKDEGKSNYNIGKVALLKELGRAAYKNPLYPVYKVQSEGFLPKEYFSEEINEPIKRRSEGEITRLINEGRHDIQLSKCPVCGVDSLVVHRETEYNTDNNNCLVDSFDYPYMLECTCCSFRLTTEIENPDEYGFKEIENYWI